MCLKTRFLRATSRTTPGIPSVPETKAVTGLIESTSEDIRNPEKGSSQEETGKQLHCVLQRNIQNVGQDIYYEQTEGVHHHKRHIHGLTS